VRANSHKLHVDSKQLAELQGNIIATWDRCSQLAARGGDGGDGGLGGGGGGLGGGPQGKDDIGIIHTLA
jgi:hypothetical protein